MRKVFLFCALLAGIAMMYGCQKEKDVVTLKAVINQDTKAYIGSINGALYPFWNTGDRVRINGKEYTLSHIDRTYALITDVQGSDPYYAIFPSNCVRTMDVNNGTAQINIPTTQSYKKDEDGHQRVDMPMAAVNDGDILQFKNLCSIIKVNVSNAIPQTDPNYGDLKVERIVIQGAPGSSVTLCGLGNVNIAEGSLTMSGTSNYAILTGEYNNEMETITPGHNHDFYIVVPPFSGSITMRVETTTGKKCNFQVTNAVATASHMASITLAVQQLVGGGDAYLDKGTTVNAVLRGLANDNVTNIQFLYDTPITAFPGATRVDLQREGDIPIYAALSAPGYLGRQVLYFITEASHIYAHENSSYLFANLNRITQISSFDPNFITDNVTNMSYMFANNDYLSGIWGIETFNTNHVTTMDHMFYNNTKVSELDLSHFSSASLVTNGMESMFEGCVRLMNLDLSSFYTSQITSMSNLFNGCARLSTIQINNFDMSNVTNKTDMCTGLGEGNAALEILPHTANNPVHIWCPPAVQTAMSSGTGLNTSIISWHNTVIQ